MKKISDSQTNVKYYRNNELLWDSNINDVMGDITGLGWTLGQEWDRAGLSDFLNGEIDEVTFYNRGLTTNEIGELYHIPYGANESNQTKATYVDGIGLITTDKVSTINNNGNTLSYTYDKNGNIITVTDRKNQSTNGIIQTRYQYNELDELVKEEIVVINGTSETKQKMVEYFYDLGGNITSKRETSYHPVTGVASIKTVPYAYGDANWRDKLTSYDGRAITYDAIGNPLTYHGFTYTWQNGRQLAGITGNGLATSYKYNNQGYRTQKTVNGVVTTYHWLDNQVTYEESYQLTNPSNKFDRIYYTYDSDSSEE